MTESEIKGLISGHVTRNEALLEMLIDKGVSIADARSIDHHFWVNTQEEAVRLGKQLYDQGFVLSVIAPVTTTDGSNLWNVEATAQQSPGEAASLSLVERLTRLAAQFNAVYDGWGTSV